MISLKMYVLLIEKKFLNLLQEDERVEVKTLHFWHIMENQWLFFYQQIQDFMEISLIEPFRSFLKMYANAKVKQLLLVNWVDHFSSVRNQIIHILIINLLIKALRFRNLGTLLSTLSNMRQFMSITRHSKVL